MFELHTTFPESSYNQDGLVSMHNHDFMQDPSFVSAYRRGVKAAGQDYNWHWRVHIGLWAAYSALRISGDYVECGVNAGFMSSAIMSHLNWETQKRTYYLLDTFSGLDPRYVSDHERRSGILDKSQAMVQSGLYVSSSTQVRENFLEWQNVRIIEGAVPDTLSQVDAERIAFLHIDMNCSPPEVAALEYFWDRLNSGAIILLDDYAYAGYESQKDAIDDFAAKRKLCIASLPTGQGLAIRT